MEDKYGEVEEMNVCDNIGEHMIGNVYIKVNPTMWCDVFKTGAKLNKRHTALKASIWKKIDPV